MDYGELPLPEGHSFDALAPINSGIVTTEDTAPQQASKTAVPGALTKFAPYESWTSAHVKDSLHTHRNQTGQNLYLDEILLKAHEPNLVFETIRKLLLPDSYFAFRIVTAENIKFRLRQNISSSAFYVYYTGHFLFRRVFPKLKGCRKIARLLKIPVDISKAEIMGRLIYKGFDIVDLIETGYETIVISKVNASANVQELRPLPNEGFLFSMQRVGKQGKPITVYKFRSMHPYAEYVQEYLHKTNGIDAGGKFRNDFRVSTGGRLIRKYWLDELPMLINLIKGDIKLVGVRPLSEHYFSLYPPSAQQIRQNHKPGLIPPFYADMPKTFDEIVQSEITYITQYEQNPIGTDYKYLLRIINNIVFHKARSK